MSRTFADRLHAGRVLAGRVAERTLLDPIVLALPRGGVCVAQPVAEALGAPLEVLVARKLGAPMQPELALGAIAEGGPRVVDDHLRTSLHVSARALHDIEIAERAELKRRLRRYRAGRPLPGLTGRDVVLVDDGLATGLTVLASLLALRAHHPRSVLVAVPVGPPSTIAQLAPLADEVLCLEQPEPFGSVGSWYDEFPAVSDREVVRLLARRADELAPRAWRRPRRGPNEGWTSVRRRPGAGRREAGGEQPIGH